MEHSGMLALIEQKFGFSPAFEEFLRVLLEIVNTILDSGSSVTVDDTSELASVLENGLEIEGSLEYLTYIGLELVNNTFTFPAPSNFINLELAKCAIENKLKCLGVESPGSCGAIRKAISASSTRPPELPYLETDNSFLQLIHTTLEFAACHGDEELQDRARECIPLVLLQTRAINAIREQQRDIKLGSGEREMPFEMALLSELVSWFKSSFFRWVNNPACRLCQGNTTVHNQTVKRVGSDTCKVEVFNCEHCSVHTEFVRYNDPAQLLRTREGRCGEWANCFTLMCRALGYDARYVVDNTDHVWCEVYDAFKQRWTHVDPCEGAIDKPLMYEHGWNKKLEYIIAYSCEDVQDVTWRYSSHHAEVRSRRNLCTEADLLDTLLMLREARQYHLSEPRRQYLLRRCVMELAEMTLEKTPGDHESAGRISGSEKWRKQRGEFGKNDHLWKLEVPGEHRVQYWPAQDEYAVLTPGGIVDSMSCWQGGVWDSRNTRRNVESDWKMVYLARVDGSDPGHITWKFEAQNGMRIKEVTVSHITKVFDSGCIEWSASIDDGEFGVLQFEEGDGEQVASSIQDCCVIALRATLSGGTGDVAWQHAQLFRLPVNSMQAALEIKMIVQ